MYTYVNITIFFFVLIGCQRSNEIEFEVNKKGMPCNTAGHYLRNFPPEETKNVEEVLKILASSKEGDETQNVKNSIMEFLECGIVLTDFTDLEGVKYHWVLVQGMQIRSRPSGDYIMIIGDKQLSVFLPVQSARTKFGNEIVDRVIQKMRR